MRMLERKSLYILIALLVLLQSGLLVFVFKSEKASDAKREELPASIDRHRSYFMNQVFYDEAFDMGCDLKIGERKASGGIVPHHLIAKNKIAAYFMGLEDAEYDTIVLIGPDHFQAGQSKIVLSGSDWDTPYGLLESDRDLIQKILAGGLGAIEEAPFANEHAISGLTAFIKHSWPQAKIVPIILSSRLDHGEAERLAQVIHASSGSKKIFVLASADFSHDQTRAVSDVNDRHSREVIEAFDYGQIYDIEVDSPASIFTVLKYCDLVGARTAELIYSSNSADYVGDDDEPTTSHLYYDFR